MKITATIITFNEEDNIQRCLNSLDFVDEIVVVDSFSTDKTKEICSQFKKVTFIQNSFHSYGHQKNFAASKAQYNWIISVDADEEVTQELKESILENIKKDVDALSVNRLTSFCGKFIYRGGWFPDWLIKVYKKEKASFSEPKVHEKIILKDPRREIKVNGILNHYSFKTLESQLQANLKYSKRGAQDLISKSQSVTLFHLFFKPIGKFIECYFIKKGLLDGFFGLIIALNASYSIFMKYSIAYFDLKKIK